MVEDTDYLLSLQAVRERSQTVLEAAKKNELLHFQFDENLMPAAAEFVVGIIKRDFGPDKFHEIPPHGRWQHFNAGGVDRMESLLETWKNEGCDNMELTRRTVDLFFVSVLLDAGAGSQWKFKEPITGHYYGRSEGIAVASLYMFTSGAFSSFSNTKINSVDGLSLSQLDMEAFKKHFQISEESPMVGVASRVELLNRVGSSLSKLTDIFGQDGRPGNMVDFMAKSAGPDGILDFELLWSILQKVLIPSWPNDRTHIDGHPIGDAWPLEILRRKASEKNDGNMSCCIQPFHKLTQWLAYSLMVPFVRLLGRSWIRADLATGLPEYRNGGLFIDLQVLQLRSTSLQIGLQSSGGSLPIFSASGDVIVEWRALTVALLDKLYAIISDYFKKDGIKLTMAQMLEAGTWKAGRELAAKNRPATLSSPILIQGDGTLF